MMHYFDPTVTWSLVCDALIDLLVVETSNLEHSKSMWPRSEMTTGWTQYASAHGVNQLLFMTFLDQAPTREEGRSLQTYLDSLRNTGTPYWLYRSTSGTRRITGKMIELLLGLQL